MRSSSPSSLSVGSAAGGCCGACRASMAARSSRGAVHQQAARRRRSRPATRRARCRCCSPISPPSAAAPTRIVVVDDGSDDGTAAVARTAAGATVLAPGGPPPGWAGKPWACWNGSQATTAPLLVFLDADVRLAPDTLARLVATRSRPAACCRCSRSTSRAGGRGPVDGAQHRGAGRYRRVRRTTGRTDGRVRALPGLRPPEYLAVGGHALVREAVAEDAALAERFRARGSSSRSGRDAT